MDTPAERIEKAFPRLRADGYAIHSDADPGYNCFAFAAGVTDARWDVDSDGYWPPGVPRTDHLASVIAAFRTLGYEVCADSAHEPGVERVAVYGLPAPDDTFLHAARQLADGRWVSKLGRHEDIIHATLTGLEGEEYGQVLVILRRGVMP